MTALCIVIMLAEQPQPPQPQQPYEDPNFEWRLNEATAGLQRYVRTHLLERISRTNAITIVEYIQALKSESNPTIYHKQNVIETLKHLSEFHGGNNNTNKSFRDMSRQDILSFLDRLRPKSDDQDPLHHWVGTYNNNVITINRFFKWLYYPLLEPANRPKPEPIMNVRKLKRKEKEIYKDTDLWLDSDCNRIFFKHITSVRDKAFHALMLDTSCRPKELMNAKIKDLEFKDEGYNQKFAYLWVTGKSGKRIKKLLVKSLPYLRDWLNHGNHPRPEDPNAYILCGSANRNKGQKLERHTFSHNYLMYRKELFPKLLESSEVSEEDKQIIKEKILTKPIRPYILRHTSLTEKAQLIGEYNLRLHADWTTTSKMPQRYLHFGGNESTTALEKAQGIMKVKADSMTLVEACDNSSSSGALSENIICSHCKEPNKPDSKFCANSACGMVLKFEAYTETIGETDKLKGHVERLQARQERMQRTMDSLLRVITGQSDTIKVFAPDDPETTRILNKLAEQNG